MFSSSSSSFSLGFQSTLPVGGATACTNHCQQKKKISIHAPRGGSDYALICDHFFRDISIHAPRGGSDFYVPSRLCWTH